MFYNLFTCWDNCYFCCCKKVVPVSNITPLSFTSTDVIVGTTGDYYKVSLYSPIQAGEELLDQP